MEVFCDLEVQNVEYKGQKASPFCPSNYIVAPGWAVQDGPINHEYFYSRGEADESDWAERALSEATIFVAHNATFEIHWMMHRHYRPFMDFLKRGGRVFCTQMAEYIITHQTHTYPALEECAVKYGGTKKIDEVKLLWEQGYLTSQIEESLLLRYLVDEREGDIANTRLVYYNQMSELVHQGMIDMAWWRMDALLFNAISTFNGLYVDRATADKNHAEQLARVQELRAELQGYLPADLPEEFEFNYGSDFHMSALLFGGPIKYDKKVSYEPKKYEKADFYKFGSKYVAVADCTPDKFSEYENLYGWVDVYKAGKNKGSPKVHSLETDVEKLKWGEDYYTFEGLISFSDLPTHVSDLYLSKRAEFRGKRTLADDVTPVYSTSKDSLDILSKFTDVAKPVTELAQLEKDNGTYYIAHEYNAKGDIKKTKGMLQYVGEDSIIHHQLNGTSTITGRLSSSNPNL